MRIVLIPLLIVLLSASYLAQSVPLVFGSPSNAVADLTRADNFLVEHFGYVLSYNRRRGSANWVTWHLQKADLGPIERTNAFRGDDMLPAAWRIVKADYGNSGFHRGHLCPSEDRSTSVAVNRETFFMSNMQPQVPRLNSGTWKSLESYVQNLVRVGWEAYITAGCYGDGGRLKNKVTVPTSCWKIVLVLPIGNNDLQRVNQGSRVIAVDMPNDASIRSGWRNYRTTVDQIEGITGFDFLNTLPDHIEQILESRADTQ